jgi:integrase
LSGACQSRVAGDGLLSPSGWRSRSAAILELTWDRVDFLTGIVDLKAPELVDWMKKKVKKGRAKVLMTDWLREELIIAKNQSLTGHVIEWDGEPIKCIRKSFVSVCERAGFGHWVARPATDDPKRRVFVPSITPHVLRHTAISWMEEAGVPMSVISRFAGHDDENTTRKNLLAPAPRQAHATGGRGRELEVSKEAKRIAIQVQKT